MIYQLIRTLVTAFLRTVYAFDVSGLENLPSDKPTIIVANHLSFIDSLFIPVALDDRRVTFIAKAEYFSRRPFAWLMRVLGQIPCDRSSENGGVALDAAARELAAGRVIAIYPEGTRSRNGSLYRGHTGAARLAAQTGAVLVPCGIRGTDKVMPIGMRRPRIRGRKSVRLSFQAPINVRKLGGPDVERAARPITDLVMLRIRRATGQIYVDRYARRDTERRQLALPPFVPYERDLSGFQRDQESSGNPIDAPVVTGTRG